jgi:fumarylacetoacetate (FAA) hydrolase family protein
MVFNIPSRAAPLVADICAMEDPAAYVRGAAGQAVGVLDDLMAAPVGDMSAPHLLAPCDFQAIKACGVTFAGSMVERVIEERAGGDPARADAIRARVGAVIGDSLRDLVPG